MSQSTVCNSTTDECSAPITALAARPIDASGQIAVPGRFGVFGLGDVDRVFYDQDPDGADTWHRRWWWDLDVVYRVGTYAERRRGKR